MVRGASAGAAAAKGWEEVGVRLRHRLREAGGGQDHGHRLAGEVPPVADQGGRRQGRCPRDSVTVSRDKSKITVTSEWRPSPSGNHKAFPVLCPNSDFILSIVGCIAFFFHWIGSQ
ncbi:hypothetical protein GW17_00041516 [Ensete ventricosum]|nr:hypothetical protein GW17_00041516 [Ensete ventricosum]